MISNRIFILALVGFFFGDNFNLKPVTSVYATLEAVPTFFRNGSRVIIDFNDGGKPDEAELVRVRSEYSDDEMDFVENECIWTGYLRDESNVAITVNGCTGNDTFQVVLNSNRSFDSMFMVHAGHTAAYHLDPRQVSGTGSYASIVTLHDEDLAKKGLSFGQDDNTQNPLPSSFKVTLSLSYDNFFLNEVCGGDHGKAKQRAAKIVELAQCHFRDFKGLGSSITLVVIEVKYINDELKLREKDVACNATCILNRTGNIASQNPIHADNYHFISADNPPLWSDISGIASRIGYSHWNYFGSVCWNNKIHRVGVTEFFGNPRDWEGGKLGASLTFAHELGHSLAMPHDFIDTNSNMPRKDDLGNSCLVADNIMGYKTKRKEWSTCSKEAIAGWFKQLSDLSINCKADGGETKVTS